MQSLRRPLYNLYNLPWQQLAEINVLLWEPADGLQVPTMTKMVCCQLPALALYVPMGKQAQK